MPPTPITDESSTVYDENSTLQASDDGEDTLTQSPEDTFTDNVIHWDDGVVFEDLEETKEINLTTMSSTMVFAHIYNMMISPDEYLGKTIVMTGEFVVYEDPESGVVYTACLIVDALACCAQGLEFVLDETLVYPEDYPKLNANITVSGTFELYEEDGFSYIRLNNASVI